MRKTALAALLAVTCLACGNSDSSSDANGGDVGSSTTGPLPTNPQGDVELCSLAVETLPGSADEPATNEELEKSLNQRAESMARVAAASSGELADALSLSSEAMRNLAKAVVADADPAALNNLIADLQDDAAFAAAQEVIDKAVNGQCEAGNQ